MKDVSDTGTVENMSPTPVKTITALTRIFLHFTMGLLWILR